MSAGLALSRRYWENCGLPSLQAADPALMEHMAVGLCGQGSECFGYDDEISEDHDWGVGFCVWLNTGNEARFGDMLRRWYEELPMSFEGVPKKRVADRVGVFQVERFFERFIGQIPQTPMDWTGIPEYALAVCVNGEVFHDPVGDITRVRASLSSPPLDVRRKRIAAGCVTMMQAGQYNLPRCIQRGEQMAAALAVQEFVQAAASVMFVMNGRWKPFYKWMPRALRELPQPAPHLEQQLEALLCDGGLSLLDPHARETQVHICCSMLADALRLNGWTDIEGCDMQQIGLDIRNRIMDPQLRALPVLLA